MHGKYNQRRPHAERDYLRKRQNSSNLSGEGAVDDLPRPITLTFIETIPVATSSSSTEWTTSTSFSTILGIPTIPPESSSTSTTNSDTTSTSATSTTTSAISSPSNSSTTTLPSPIPSLAAPATTSIMTSDTDKPQSPLASASSSSTLSGGGIAGIVIGVLVLLVAVALILLRRGFIKKRKYATGAWARRSIGPPVLTFGGGYSEPKPFVFTSAPGATDEPASPSSRDEGRVGNLVVRNVDQEDIAPPPAALNSPATLLATQYVPVILSPSLSVVVCTFITTLPDELAIGIGEQIRVLAEYDDGWALGMNSSGEQGMIPLECLDRGVFKKTQIALIETRNSRRISSLNALRTSSYNS